MSHYPAPDVAAIFRDAGITNAHPADVLGELKARIADLKELADIEHAKLCAMGTGEYEGETFRAVVKIGAVSKRINPDLVRELLSPDDVELVTVDSVSNVVRVNAKTGKRKRA